MEPELPQADLESLRTKVQMPPRYLVLVLVGLAVLYIIPLLLSQVWIYRQAEIEIEEFHLSRDRLRARTLAALFERELLLAHQALESTARRTRFLQAWAARDLPAVATILDELRQYQPALLSVSLYELDGTLRTISPHDPIVGDNFAFRDWYKGVTRNWESYVSEVYRTHAGEKPLVVALAVAVKDAKGSPAGILKAALSLDAIQRKLEHVELGSWGTAYIVDQRGALVAGPATDPFQEPQRAPHFELVRLALAGVEGASASTEAGAVTYVGYAPIPRLAWAVLYRHDAAESIAALDRLRQRGIRTRLYLVAIYLLTVAFAGSLVARYGRIFAANSALNQSLQSHIAGLRKAHAELQTAKEQVEQASRFKDQFLSTMSHELRTPLNAVLGFSELLNDPRYGPLTERQARYVEHIRSGGQHLIALINDILDLSKIESGRVDLVIDDLSLERTCSEVLAVLRPLAAKKSHALSLDVAPGLVVQADATCLRQVLLNLAGNAIKFTPQGGSIRLAAHPAEGGTARIQVIDNGPGIPPEEHRRIFEAFYRLRQGGEKTEGTGLGLAITQRLIELQGGSLHLDSTPGHGSCFYFHLPRAGAHKPEQSFSSGPAALHGMQHRILVVEDDPAAAQLLRSQLESCGYEVILCDDPRVAVKTAAEFTPDAITLDVVMRPLTGWEILSDLRQHPQTSRIPVVVVTIVEQPALALALGADEYLTKPVQREVLLAAVNRSLAGRQAQHRKARVLVVEDDPAAREVVVELLSSQGHIVTAVADGAQAREQLRKPLPDLVVLDLNLPNASGFELLAEWRAEPRTAALPVFVLTGRDLSGEEEHFLRTNCSLLLRKHQPWLETLDVQLRRVLGPRSNREA